MHPELVFVVGHTRVLISTHAAAVVIAVLAGTLLAVRRARDPAHALLAAPLVAVTTLGGAQLAFVALRGGGDAAGGLASVGGVAGLVAGLALAARVLRCSVVELLDVFAPAALLALGIGRVGCFLAGCCHGAPTPVPWGVVMPSAGALPRHPLQLYSAAVDVGLVVWLLRAPRTPGSVARRACVGFGVARFVLELLRDPATTNLLPGGVLTLPQAVALVLVVVGLLAGTGLVGVPRPRLRPARRSAGASRR